VPERSANCEFTALLLALASDKRAAMRAAALVALIGPPLAARKSEPTILSDGAVMRSIAGNVMVLLS
jgi:hypothetical protein